MDTVIGFYGALRHRATEALGLHAKEADTYFLRSQTCRRRKAKLDSERNSSLWRQIRFEYGSFALPHCTTDDIIDTS